MNTLSHRPSTPVCSLARRPLGLIQTDHIFNQNTSRNHGVQFGPNTPEEISKRTFSLRKSAELANRCRAFGRTSWNDAVAQADRVGKRKQTGLGKHDVANNASLLSYPSMRTTLLSSL